MNQSVYLRTRFVSPLVHIFVFHTYPQIICMLKKNAAESYRIRPYTTYSCKSPNITGRGTFLVQKPERETTNINHSPIRWQRYAKINVQQRRKTTVIPVTNSRPYPRNNLPPHSSKIAPMRDLYSIDICPVSF